jgi:hypothetical protein
LAFSWTDKPWFLTEGKFAAVLIIPSSWGSQLDGDLHQHRAASSIIFWRRCRGKRRLLQGEFRTHILYFVHCFALLYFYLHRFIKNTKKISSLYSCYFNHISMHKDVEEKSLAELATNYAVASAYLVHMLEARFASLNPFMQHMFLKLHDIEDPKKKAFILETLRTEFRDVAIEARKVFRRFNKLGSHVEVVGTTNEDF